MFHYLELNASIDALQEVNTTVVQLVNLTQVLQTQLNNITTETMALNMGCMASSNAAVNAVCGNISTTSYSVTVDYTAVSLVSMCVYVVCGCVRVCGCVHMCGCACVCI